MSETLWITIPTNEENELKNIISSISSKNLPNLSINQLIEKLENNQAADWIAVLAQYNAIPSVNNIDTSEMLDRARSVRNKFAERGFRDLQVRQFEPRELLSLVILCYSNPVLIGSKLCTALNDNNNENVKKEMLQFSAYRKSEDRVLPSQSNLRLLGSRLFFDDPKTTLPNSVKDRVILEAIRDKRIVRIVDQRNGFEERIDGSARARNEGVQEITPRKKRDGSEIDSHHIWQSLKAESGIAGKDHTQSQLAMPASASQMGYSANGSELVTEALPLNSSNKAAPGVNLNPMLIMGVTALAFAKHIPVISPVTRNMVRSVKDICSKAIDSTTSFFSSVKPIQPSKEERLEEQQPIFKTGCN
ncbi:hypothetical protein [Rickettsiella endosymbiont of Xylota segnis]|uniref:hypothetical protein n=1 Tax=Rickettsiella endosymbiont of Xylota segnis TaxID=3066238 RepID=UPI0030CC2DDA